jgi:N-acetylglucosamine-6-phosphate deacetylase
MTQSHDTMASALQNIKNYRCEKHSGAKIAGVYLEGPYFSQKYKGAQNPEYIRNPSVEEFNEFQEISGNCIKVISLAPETEGAQDFINKVSKNITVAVGHTDSDYDTAMQAIKNGATDFTHTFNGMRGIHHREPNAVGAAFDTDAYCECIGDGIHIHQAIIRLLYKVKGRDRLIFISDSIRPAGLADGEYSSGGQKVCVTDGKAYLEGGVLAGSTTYLLKCVKNAVKFGIPLNDAVKAASLNPARAAGISDTVGSLSVGKQADILVLNKELEIQHIILDGKIIK